MASAVIAQSDHVDLVVLRFVNDAHAVAVARGVFDVCESHRLDVEVLPVARLQTEEPGVVGRLPALVKRERRVSAGQEQVVVINFDKRQTSRRRTRFGVRDQHFAQFQQTKIEFEDPRMALQSVERNAAEEVKRRFDHRYSVVKEVAGQVHRQRV